MKIINFMIRIVIFSFSMTWLLSCSTPKPYEITSPCVSGESDNPYYRAPCQRRPVNSTWELS